MAPMEDRQITLPYFSTQVVGKQRYTFTQPQVSARYSSDAPYDYTKYLSSTSPPVSPLWPEPIDSRPKITPPIDSRPTITPPIFPLSEPTDSRHASAATVDSTGGGSLDSASVLSKSATQSTNNTSNGSHIAFNKPEEPTSRAEHPLVIRQEQEVPPVQEAVSSSQGSEEATSVLTEMGASENPDRRDPPAASLPPRSVTITPLASLPPNSDIIPPFASLNKIGDAPRQQHQNVQQQDLTRPKSPLSSYSRPPLRSGGSVTDRASKSGNSPVPSTGGISIHSQTPPQSPDHVQASAQHFRKGLLTEIIENDFSHAEGPGSTSTRNLPGRPAEHAGTPRPIKTGSNVLGTGFGHLKNRSETFSPKKQARPQSSSQGDLRTWKGKASSFRVSMNDLLLRGSAKQKNKEAEPMTPRSILLNPAASNPVLPSVRNDPKTHTRTYPRSLSLSSLASIFGRRTAPVKKPVGVFAPGSSTVSIAHASAQDGNSHSAASVRGAPEAPERLERPVRPRVAWSQYRPQPPTVGQTVNSGRDMVSSSSASPIAETAPIPIASKQSLGERSSSTSPRSTFGFVRSFRNNLAPARKLTVTYGWIVRP